MIIYFRDYLITFVSFLLIDMVWLVFIAKDLYKKYLGYLMSPTVNWGAALLFYALFIVGILFFVVHPALEKNQIQYALMAGALFGLITYATYDLTNLATIKDWPVTITIIDLIWGTSVSALTSTLSFWVIKRFFM